ncbi:MAG: M3 family metallopeptidase [Prolixibacteraceae bacterium]
MRTSFNPLLSIFETPFETVPFRQVLPEHFKPALKLKIRDAKRALKKVTGNLDRPTFKNTIEPVEIKYEEVTRLGIILFNLDSAETNLNIQAATKKLSPILTRFETQVMLNKKYFKRVETIYLNRKQENLSSEEERLLEVTYSDMKRNGANLSFLKKIRLTRVQIQLSKKTLQFNNHVLAETNAFYFHTTNKTDLDGLPKNELEAAALLAKAKGKEGWIVNLQQVSYEPFIKYAHNRTLREKLYRAYGSRCNQNNKNDNKLLIRKICQLRLQQANILGYTNYAHYVLEERMAQSPKKVHQFLSELHRASSKHAHLEIDEVKKLAEQLGQNDELMPWDLSYYSEKLKERQYSIDENMVKSYFKLENVIEGVFGLATTLYGITFHKVDHIETYHNEVSTFEVYDEDKKLVSILYTDFHPRESKQSGAWMTEFRAQSNVNGQMKRPHISICCNFTQPTANKPSLLTFSEVTTLLHEFGHAIHGMLANTTYPSLSGTNVYQDFVELPSQLMENWGTELEWLQKFAFHYKTGEPIPQELLQQLIKARNFQSGYLSERQLTFALLDMAWHEIEAPCRKDIDAFEKEACTLTQYLPVVEGTCISTTFSHIFSGSYAAGYYGYKWAEVLDADAFSAFKAKGIFNSEIANRFKTELLEKGGTVHPMKLYLNFRGQEPKLDALLQRSGLK